MNARTELFVTFPAIDPVVAPDPTDTVPAEIVVPPEYVFSAVSVKVFAEFIDTDPAPEMMPLSVWLALGDMLSAVDVAIEIAPPYDAPVPRVPVTEMDPPDVEIEVLPE